MSAPERVRLAPNGGLPTGNWPKSELVEYIRADVAMAQREEALQLLLSVDDLAQIIRTADGDHTLGAGALAEAIIAAIIAKSEGKE